MPQIHDLSVNGKRIYPSTIPQAVVDPETGKNITKIFASKNVATSSSLGLIKSGPDVVVGGDGSVTVNNRIIPKMYKMGVNSKYKLFSILSGGDKASTTFSILSPVLSNGLGYAKYIVYRPYESATVKNWYPRCLYATDSTMYNRIKLVRTGDNTFDVYYQSNTGNDYCTFILDETTQTDLEIVAAGVSSIPEDVYAESGYAPVYFGEVYGTLRGNADTATKATQDVNGNNIASTYQNKIKPIPFNNASDAINIDNYPQDDYGTIAIWFNQAEADGYPPGREGLVLQTKYRSELGDSGTSYVDCLTQFYIGNEGVRHRTIIDYDASSKFENTPWSKIDDDWYYNLGTMSVSSSTTSSANVTFSSSSAFSTIRTLLNGLSLTTMSNAMPNITLGFSLSTDSGITHYIRAKVCSISRLSNGNYMLIAMFSNPVFYNDNAINVLRITINASSYVCQTLKAL